MIAHLRDFVPKTALPAPYVYRLTHLTAVSDEPIYYVGVRTFKRSQTPFPWEDIGKRYFTSSPRVRALFQARPQDFDIKIIGIFPTYKRAWLFEQRLLQRCGVPFNPLFFNQAVATAHGLMTRRGTVSLWAMNHLPIKNAQEFAMPRPPVSIGLTAYKTRMVRHMLQLQKQAKKYYRPAR